MSNENTEPRRVKPDTMQLLVRIEALEKQLLHWVEYLDALEAEVGKTRDRPWWRFRR